MTVIMASRRKGQQWEVYNAAQDRKAKAALRKAKRQSKALRIGKALPSLPGATSALVGAKRKRRRKVIRISRCDARWSKLVRARDGGACRKPGCDKREPANVLHAHHVIGRGKKATRLLLDNGITLCVHHHIWGDDSAHKIGKQFVIDIIGQAEYDRLHELSLTHKTERQAVAEFLERHGKKAA